MTLIFYTSKKPKAEEGLFIFDKPEKVFGKQFIAFIEKDALIESLEEHFVYYTDQDKAQQELKELVMNGCKYATSSRGSIYKGDTKQQIIDDYTLDLKIWGK